VTTTEDKEQNRQGAIGEMLGPSNLEGGKRRSKEYQEEQDENAPSRTGEPLKWKRVPTLHIYLHCDRNCQQRGKLFSVGSNRS